MTEIRRFLLKDLPRLPIAGEYIHRVAYDIGAEYGKDTFMFIEKFGTAKVPAAFALKDKVDGYLEKIGLRSLSDKMLQMVTKLLPNHLPKRMNEFRDLYEHHLMIRIENQNVEQVERFLNEYFQHKTSGDFFRCTDEEGRKAFLHRFAVAGAFLGALADSIDDRDLNAKNFLKDVGHGLIQNGPSDLSHSSNFTKLTENVMPKKDMIYHSIMGNITNSTDPNVMTDGIVPYTSSH